MSDFSEQEGIEITINAKKADDHTQSKHLTDELTADLASLVGKYMK